MKKIQVAKVKGERDYFASIFPTAEDQKLLKTIPDKPSKPTLPTAYTGPTTDNVNSFSSWGGPTGGFGMPTITEFTAIPNVYAGKSFGVVGQGTNTGTAATITASSADIGKFVDLGVTPNVKSAAGAFLPHYMIITAAPLIKTSTSWGPVKLVVGAKAWKQDVKDFYKVPTQPSAAADPTAQTSATYLTMSVITALSLIALV